MSTPVKWVIASSNRGIVHCAFLHAGDADGNADRDIRLDAKPALPTSAHFVNEIAQHRFGYHIVGDDAVAHRTHDFDAFRCASEHRFRFLSQRNDTRIGKG